VTQRDSPRRGSALPALSVAALTALLSWGSFAFAGVYPWAWQPLLGGAGLIGISGLVFGRRPSHGVGLVLALWALCVLCVGAQLLPVSRTTLEAVSPAAIRLLSEYSLSFAVQTHHAVSIEPGLTTTTLIFASVLGLFLAGLDRLLSSLVIERLTKSTLAIGVLLAVVGIAQRSSPRSPIYGFWYPAGGLSDAFGPFINRNHFAGWMVMACGLGLGYFQGLLAEKRPPRTWQSRFVWLGSREGTRIVLTTFALGIMMLATTWSISRSGIASLVVVIVSSMLFARPTGSRSGLVRLARPIVISLMLIAGLWRGVDVIAGRFTTPDSLLTRLGAWRDTWSIVRDFPLTGTGMNTYTVATLFYQRSNEGVHLAEAHNDYLQLLSDGGLLVAVPVVCAILAAIRVVRARWTSLPPSVRIGAVQRGAALGLLGIAVQEMAEFSLQKPANAVLFVILLAIAMYEPGRSHPSPSRNILNPTLGGTPTLKPERA